MCTPEKKVRLWSHYLNSQLGILWENATTCGDTGREECNYYRALAYFDYVHDPANNSPKVSFKFKKPQLLFLCNHYAVLFLTVEEGSLTPTPGGTEL